MYRNETHKGGASNWPIVTMIKCMMLQKWFNLSEPMLEEMLNDRISQRKQNRPAFQRADLNMMPGIASSLVRPNKN